MSRAAILIITIFLQLPVMRFELYNNFEEQGTSFERMLLVWNFSDSFPVPSHNVHRSGSRLRLEVPKKGVTG